MGKGTEKLWNEWEGGNWMNWGMDEGGEQKWEKAQTLNRRKLYLLPIHLKVDLLVKILERKINFRKPWCSVAMQMVDHTKNTIQDTLIKGLLIRFFSNDCPLCVKHV